MSSNPAKTLELLFAIGPDVIMRDLRRAEEDLRAIAEEIRAIKANSLDVGTPEIKSKRSHLFMVQAYGLCHRDTVAPELQTFYAAFGAGHIAQDAEMVAAYQDTCAELSAQMDVIRRREGLAEGEFWVMRDEGPQDYRELSDQYGVVLERIADTVFSFVLRRYHLNRHADLFERDRTTFEIQREIGNRVVAPVARNEAEVRKMMDDQFRRQYGGAAFKHVLTRVKEIQREGA
jgi:hypothetical protein